jgi:hypothetical protein
MGGGVGPEVEAGQWQVTGTQVHDPPPDGRELVCGNGKALPGTMSWSYNICVLELIVSAGIIKPQLRSGDWIFYN